MSNENKNLKALKCENCGGDIAKSYRVIDEDESIPVAKCLSCGTEYDPSSEEYYLYFADEFNENSSNSIFKLGMKGKIEGVEYEIIGRLRYKEQDPDDYEEGIWDEWFTVSSDGGFHYFVEEDGKVLSYNEYIPNSIDMDSDSSYIYFDGKAISKNSAYIGRVILAEGELPWEPDIGEPVKCYDIKNNGEKFSIEQSEDEITICKSTKIPYKDIIDGFDLDEHRENYNETMTQRKKFLLKSKIYLVAMFISLGLLFTTCSTGSKVKGVMNKQIVITDNELKVENGKPSYHSNVLYGPFRLENKEGLYNITIGINERIKRLNSEWQSFGFMIIKEENLKRIKDNLENKLELKKFFNQIDLKKEPIESFSIAGSFWDERGYDSDGSWHENDLVSTSSVVIKEGGLYYAYLEMLNKNKRPINSVVFSLRSDKVSKYYLISFILMLVLWLLNKNKGKNYNTLPFDIS